MHRYFLLLISALSLIAASCGGTSDTTVSASTGSSPAPTSTIATTSPTTDVPTTLAAATTTDIAAFCRATTEFNAILLLSALTSLGGTDAQDLYLLTKIPELVAASTGMADNAPPAYAGQAATLADMYQTISQLAEERGLSASRLAELAADIDDDDSLTADELFAALGFSAAEIAKLFEDAQLALGDKEPPLDLYGADVADLGCPVADLEVAACELLGDAELVPLVGDSYTTKTTPIEGIGEQCTIRGDGMALVDLTLAGPSFYIPAVWNEIEMVEDLGDEAFLTTGMDPPFLYVRQANTVISLYVANVDPPLTVAQLTDLIRVAVSNAGG